MMAIAADMRRKNPHAKAFVAFKDFFIAGLTFLIICVPFFFLIVGGANPEAPKLENKLKQELASIKQPAKAELLREVRVQHNYKDADVRIEAHYQSELSPNDIKKFFDTTLLKNGWHACKEEGSFKNAYKQHILLVCKDDFIASINSEENQHYYMQIEGAYNVLFIPDRFWWRNLNWQMLTGERN